jgi:hypothetical protein
MHTTIIHSGVEMTIRIHTLPTIEGGYGSGSLPDDIEAGLLGSVSTIPGDQEADRAWAYKRSVPTLVLYDEAGLRSVRDSLPDQLG